MRALVLGCGGQDGSYMCELLLSKGYEVHGMYRRTSTPNLSRIEHVREELTLHRGDLCDHGSLLAVLDASRPEEVYNLADQDNVDWSYETPQQSMLVTAGAVSALLEALRGTKVKLVQPISATVFGDSPPPQVEDTPLHPLSPYACAKAHAWHLCRYHRDCYGTHVSCPILYNHDSPRRGPEYLLHRLCIAAIRKDVLDLHDVRNVLDIGYAKDYVADIHRTVDVPGDYVIGGSAYMLQDWLAMCGTSYRLARKPAYRPGPACELIGDNSKFVATFGMPTRTLSAKQLCDSIKEKYVQVQDSLPG